MKTNDNAPGPAEPLRHTPSLSIRAGETMNYLREEPRPQALREGNLYAVALCPLLALPGAPEGQAPGMTVACAERVGNRWNWVHLEAQTRALLAEDLGADEGYRPGTWAYLHVFRFHG